MTINTKLLETFYAGTAVKITSVLNITTPTTARISIVNPSSVSVISNVDMTREADGIYSYILQTASTWVEGDYIATIDVTYAGYQAVTQQKFTIQKQEV